MARGNNTTSNVTVTLNGAQAEKALKSLQKEYEKLSSLIKTARAEGDKTQESKLVKQQAQVKKQIDSSTKSVKNYQQALRHLDKTSLVNLEKAYRTLRKEVRQLTVGTDEYVRKSRQLALLKQRIDSVNASMVQQTTLMRRMASNMNRYFLVVSSAIAGLTGLNLTLKHAAREAAELDDVYSDVMKTTGLTRDQVVELNMAFQKIDTRTSRQELNRLAWVAGKLGISGVKDILEFVRATDKINVALGEDLGEGAIRNIGKLSDVFKLTKEMGIEKAYLAIGSAVNELGQASTAAEQYLIEFAQRNAGVAQQMGLSIQNMLGYASGLDQSAMKVEMAATAFQRFIMEMYSNTSAFARYANMELEDFADLMNRDVNQAIITVLTNMNAKGGFGQLVPIFQSMGLDGARAVAVLSAMATNIEAITQAQELSNKAFSEQTSITEEFAKKNNNRMAQLEKAQKRFKDMIYEFGESLSGTFIRVTNLSASALRFFITYRKEILSALAAVVALTIAIKAKSIALAVSKTVVASYTVVTRTLSGVMYLLQGNVLRAAVAFRAANRAMSASVVGLLITAFTALAVAIVKVATAQTTLKKANKDFFGETQKAKLEMDSLLGILKSNSSETRMYKEALDKLRESYGPLINDLINEKGQLTDIEEARRRINQEIESSIALKIREASIDEVTTKRMKKMADEYERLVSDIQKAAGLGEEAARIMASQSVEMIKQGEALPDMLSVIFGDTGDWNNAKALVEGRLRWMMRDYSKMLSEIESINKRFNPFIAPLSGEPATGTGGDATTGEGGVDISDQAFEAEMEKLKAEQAKRLNTLKMDYLKRTITQEQYEQKSENLSTTYLEKINALYLKYGKDNTDAQGKVLDQRIKLQEAAQKKLSEQEKQDFETDLQSLTDSEKKRNNVLKQQLLDGVITQEQYEAQSLESSIEFLKLRNEVYLKYGQDNLDVYSQLLDKLMEQMKRLEAGILPEEAATREFERLVREAEHLRLSLAKQGVLNQYAFEKQQLEAMLSYKLLSNEQYEAALYNLRVTSAREAVNKMSSILQMGADLAGTIQENAYARLEEQKEKELTLAGSNSEERARIEQDYEEKKLATQKKYADMDMMVKISQGLANYALSITQAFATLPTAAALAMLPFLTATLGFQVAAIVKQRNAIRNSSVEPVSGTGSVTARTVKGYATGGFTSKDRDDLRPVGTVHANEWVAPAWMVRSNPLVFARLEAVRKQEMLERRGFASGGYTSHREAPVPSVAGSELSKKDIDRFCKAIDKLYSTPLSAVVSLKDLERKQETSRRFKSISGK